MTYLVLAPMAAGVLILSGCFYVIFHQKSITTRLLVLVVFGGLLIASPVVGGFSTADGRYQLIFREWIEKSSYTDASIAQLSDQIIESRKAIEDLQRALRRLHHELLIPEERVGIPTFRFDNSLADLQRQLDAAVERNRLLTDRLQTFNMGTAPEKR